MPSFFPRRIMDEWPLDGVFEKAFNESRENLQGGIKELLFVPIESFNDEKADMSPRKANIAKSQRYYFAVYSRIIGKDKFEIESTGLVTSLKELEQMLSVEERSKIFIEKYYIDYRSPNNRI